MMVISVIARIIRPSCRPRLRRRMGQRVRSWALAPVRLPVLALGPVPALGLGRSRRILSRAGMPGGAGMAWMGRHGA